MSPTYRPATVSYLVCAILAVAGLEVGSHILAVAGAAGAGAIHAWAQAARR